MPEFHRGREELGQNFLVHQKYKSILVERVSSSGLPVLEMAGGDGALSVQLAQCCSDLTVVEIDPRRVKALRRRIGRRAKVVQADLLTYRLPAHPHTIVGNLPFHLTTATLKRLLPAPHWEQAVLLVQWEVARRRAGVGGASMLTVMWQPWFEFELICRVPARAFDPAPSVDGGVITMTRRSHPPIARRGHYQRFVQSVFKADGSTLKEKVSRSKRLSNGQMKTWLSGRALPTRALPRHLEPEDWFSLYERANQ